MKKQSRKSASKKSAKTILKKTKEPLPKELYNILACPECKGKVAYDPKKTSLKCSKCKETYPIKNGIPIMLPKSMR